MTTAEEKIREISDKLVNRIDELREEGYDDAAILAAVRNYLLGVTDGIDFSEEMRNQDAISLEHVAENYLYKMKQPSDEKAFANEWMNNGGFHPEDHPEDADQDIT